MRYACVLVALLLSASAPPPPTSSPVLAAMRQELQRTMPVLKAQPTPPYFLSYEITETHITAIEGQDGTISSDKDERRRVLTTDVRVGSARFDNTHEVPGGFPMEFMEGFSWSDVPLDNDANAIHRVLWSDTDRKYKRAVEQLTEGKSNAQVSVAPEDSSPDFAMEPAVHHVDAPVDISVDQHVWKDKIRRYTAAFAKYGDI